MFVMDVNKLSSAACSLIQMHQSREIRDILTQYAENAHVNIFLWWLHDIILKSNFTLKDEQECLSAKGIPSV